MNQLCGCCEGIEQVTPVSNVNRPGLSSLAYRVGTHATFLESMLARTSLHSFKRSESDAAVSQTQSQAEARPLQSLSTRESRDPAIAFLDAWATVGDVLTFYQERIANEGFLRTAVERRSVLELAWLIGYKLRPGVSASTYLAYSLDPGTEAVIPAGTRAQSIPGPGELPQPFETAEDLLARGDWNLLQVRLTRPQLITIPLVPGKPIYFKGTATNLKEGDPILIVSQDPILRLSDRVAERLYRVIKVEPEPAADRTKVILQDWIPGLLPPPAGLISAIIAPEALLKQIIERHQKAEVFGVNVQSRMAQRVLLQLHDLEANVNALSASSGSREDFLKSLWKTLTEALPGLREEHRLAREANFTKLEPWIGSLVSEIEQVREELSSPVSRRPGLTQVTSLLKALEIRPSIHPGSRQQLGASIENVLSGASDALPKIFELLRQDLRGTLYRALENVEPSPRAPIEVFAMRTRASVYGHNAPPKLIADPQTGRITGSEEWTLVKETGESRFDEFEIALRFVAIPPSCDITVGIRMGGSLESVTFNISPIANLTQTKPIAAANEANETIVLTISDTSQNHDVAKFTFDFTIRKFQVVIDWRKGQSATVNSAGENLVRVTHEARPFVTGGPGDVIQVAGTVEIRPAGVATEQPKVVSLDSPNSKILPGSWVALSKPMLGAATKPPDPITARVISAVDVSRADYNVPAKGAQLQLSKDWIDPLKEPFAVIRGTTVLAESELLELAEEPIDPVNEAVSGDRIELANVVNGLEPGRWLVITGERADIIVQPMSTGQGGLSATRSQPQTVPGVKASELVMLASVIQSFDPTLPGDKTHTTLVLAQTLAYRYKRDTIRLYGNVVRATNGETRNEVLGSGNASQALQSFKLRQSPLTYLAAPTPSGAESTLQVRVNQVLWHEADTLADLDPLARSYVTKIDDESNTNIIFGNGEKGARLSSGQENVTAVYRSGIGKVGNVKAGQVTLLVTKPLNVKEVINPQAATGGADREDRDQARRNAPLAIAALDRLVSTRDYEDFARTFAGVAKASAKRLSDGLRQLVHLTIAGADDIPISVNSDLYRNLRAALNKFGDPFQPIQIANRFLKLLVISANVRIRPDYIWEAVEPKIRTAMFDRFSFQKRQLGQDALLSEAIGTIQAIEGVAYVDVDTFDDVPENISAQELIQLSNELGLYPRIRSYLAQVDRSALDPDIRIRPAQLVMLSPLINETLILKELKG